MNKKTAIFTTNGVQKQLYNILKNRGVICEAFESFGKLNLKKELESFEQIILPFPSKQENLTGLPENTKLSDLLSTQHFVVGGMFSDELKAQLEKSSIEYADYFTNEAYVIKNAYLTSQGAVRLLFENTRYYLTGKKVLITGFGRIGKSLSYMLKGFGMKVFTASRREETLAEAKASGLEAFSMSRLPNTLFYYDYIFNTIPANIFSDRDIDHIRDDAVYFELASSPFGADKESFSEKGKTYISANSLPGRFYPAAVGENIADFIFSLGGD